MENETSPRHFTLGRWDICLDRGSKFALGFLNEGVCMPLVQNGPSYRIEGDTLIAPDGKVLGQLEQFHSCWAVMTGVLGDIASPILRPSKD